MAILIPWGHLSYMALREALARHGLERVTVSPSHTLTLSFHLCGRCVARQGQPHLLPELLLQLLLPELPELPLVNSIPLHGGGQTAAAAANQGNHNGPGLRKHTNNHCWSQRQEWKRPKPH